MQFIQKAYTLCPTPIPKQPYKFGYMTCINNTRGDVSMKPFAPIAALCLLAFASTSQAADPNLGRNLAATCANCHGTNGNAVKGSGMDALAGMEKSKILQKLADFRSGDKPASIMHQISKGYTDAQLDLIAGYFAAQK